MPVESFDASGFSSVDDLQGFSTPEAGQYHLVVAEVDESRKNGTNAIVVSFGILAGTTKGQENRQFREFFNDPHHSHKDGGAFNQKRRLKLLLAAGVITEDMLGKQFNVDWQMLKDRQLKARVIVEETEKKDDPTIKRKYAKIDGLNMWGPLDEDAKHIPHDAACIEAAVRAGQVNVVGKAGAPNVATVASVKPATAATAQVGLPPAVDKYANL